MNAEEAYAMALNAGDVDYLPPFRACMVEIRRAAKFGRFECVVLMYTDPAGAFSTIAKIEALGYFVYDITSFCTGDGYPRTRVNIQWGK